MFEFFLSIASRIRVSGRATAERLQHVVQSAQCTPVSNSKFLEPHGFYKLFWENEIYTFIYNVLVPTKLLDQ